MSFDANLMIRLLTTLSLGGLLFGVGLRLTGAQIQDALRRSHLRWILPLNFVAIPLLVVGLIRGLHVPAEMAVGMLLMAAAPFAPVVPVFARMARADLALAAGLTALFPFVSAFLTPVICELSLKAVPGAAALHFNFLGILGILVATITMPMTVGVALRHWRPAFAQRILRPVEIFAEATGAISLTFVTVVEFETIMQTGAKPLLAMVLNGEISLLLGYWLSGPTREIRRVTAFGASNRNIALALLVAVGSFAGTPVVGAVVTNGLVVILLGLLHVAWWRFAPLRRSAKL